MITEKQLKIFEVFAKSPFREYARKEIKHEAGEKSNNLLALTLNNLIKEEVLSEKKVGKSGVLTLNLENNKTLYYIGLCNENRISLEVKNSLEILRKEINEETHFYSIVIFGSYSVGKQTRNSDLDVAIFIENKDKQKKIEAAVNSAKLKSILEIDAHIIPKYEMIEMLTDKEENLGKQIARKHLSIYNNQIFYEIIREGIEHGFRT